MVNMEKMMSKKPEISLEDRINAVVTVAGETIDEIGDNVKDGNFKVGIAVGKTINLGNFESMRVDVTAEMWVDASQQQEAYDTLAKLAKARLVAETSKIEGKK